MVKAARPPNCKYSVRMSGVLGQSLGRKYSRQLRCVSSVRYCVISHLVLRHGKLLYDWLKPILARRCITLGRVKASERKIASGCVRRVSLMSQCQSAKGLDCGLLLCLFVLLCVFLLVLFLLCFCFFFCFVLFLFL